MAQAEDVLFCQIAITNGLLTQADAQKALSLCDKREREDGKRPLIGAVFTKYNLLKTQDVQRIYEAVRKRSGGGTATARPPGPSRGQAMSRGRSGAGARAPMGRRQAPREGDVEQQRRGKMDQQTLVMGIAGGVAFLAIIFVILWIVLRDRFSGPKIETARPADTPVSEKDLERIAESGKKPAPKPKEASSAVAKAPEGNRDPPKEWRGAMFEKIHDARGQRGDDPKQALSWLEELEKEREKRGYKPQPELTQAIDELRAAGGAPAATPPAGDAKATPVPASAPAASGEPAKAAEPPKAEKKAEEKSEAAEALDKALEEK